MKNNDAFTAYLLELGKEVYNFLLAKDATKEDAEDIIQNTFYKLYSMLSQLEHQHLRAWFYRVALNNYIDIKRTKNRYSTSINEDLLSQIADPSNEIELLIHRNEIITLMNNIKSEYREIFILKYYYELSYEEIGRLLSLNVETVRKRLYRSRKMIQKERRGLQIWINQLKKH